MSEKSVDHKECAASIWYRGRRRLGKSYELGPDGELEKGLTNTDARKMRVARFSNLEEFGALIKECNSGAAFLTTGTPKDESIVEAAVAPRRTARNGKLTRTNEDLDLRENVGSYVVIDYDPNPSDSDSLNATDLKQKIVEACAMASVDVSGVEMIWYPSSSSGFRRKSDDKQLGSGGIHLIFLVSNAQDIPRFLDALFEFLIATGSAYGVVSKSGHMLRRSIIDKAAVRATQPTFAGIPSYKQAGIRNSREETPYQFIHGERSLLRTEEIRNPTPQEIANNDRFWKQEEQRLSSEIDRAKRAWFAKQGKNLERDNQELSNAQIRRVLEHRHSGNLLADDVISLNGRQISVAEILAEPEKFDGQTGPDPIEPDYRGGAYTSKLYINALTGRPVIHSHAHGGITYFVWYNTTTALNHLKQLSKEECMAVLPTVMECTRVDDEISLEAFLKECGKILSVPKAKLLSIYENVLLANLRRTDTFGATNISRRTSIYDLAHNAAQTLINRLEYIHTDSAQIWIYNGTHHEPIPDLRALQLLREILTEDGWNEFESLTGTTYSALAALKQLTHQQSPIIARETKPILNFKNCELHFLRDGAVEQRPHDPQSGLTSVIPVMYDPMAIAPYFRKTLKRMFLDPAHIRLRPRSVEDQRKYAREMLGQAREVANHAEEILAYLLVPDRWLPRWFFWIGGGSNGKTLLTRILALLLPEEATETDRIQVLAAEFGLARLIGKTLFIDDDLETDTTLPDGLVKKVSEGKRLSTNRKHTSSVTFWNRTALLILANNYPRLVDVSAGTRRRVQSIEFPRRFYMPDEIAAMEDGSRRMHATHDRADIHALEKIEAELPGVVNVLVAAYQRLIKRSGFTMPDAVRTSNEKVINYGNPLPMFIQHECEMQKDFRTRTSTLYEAITEWSSSENLGWNPSRPQIRTMMAQLGWGPENIVKLKGYEHYVGIGLKDKPNRAGLEEAFAHSPIDDEPLWADD